MKKYGIRLACILLCIVTLSGCTDTKNEKNTNSQDTTGTSPIITQEIPEDKEKNFILEVVPED